LFRGRETKKKDENMNVTFPIIEAAFHDDEDVMMNAKKKK
jgi:hypothetical protein